MSKITHIDIPSAERAAGELSDVIGKFSKALGEIKRVAADLHGCWGNDESGEAFAAGYVTNAEEVLESSDITEASLRQVEEALRNALRLFQEVDAQGARHLEFQD
jgi:uncharacterized protein YukE